MFDRELQSIISPLTNETAELFTDILNKGLTLRVQATGKSMIPFLSGGEILTIRKVPVNNLSTGDLIFFRTRYCSLLLHRIVSKGFHGNTNMFRTKGDALVTIDDPVTEDAILGKVCTVEKNTASEKTQFIDMELPYWRAVNYLHALTGLVKSKAYFALSKSASYIPFRSLIK
jgi:signal peptidase I